MYIVHDTNYLPQAVDQFQKSFLHVSCHSLTTILRLYNKKSIPESGKVVNVESYNNLLIDMFHRHLNLSCAYQFLQQQF